MNKYQIKKSILPLWWYFIDFFYVLSVTLTTTWFILGETKVAVYRLFITVIILIFNIKIKRDYIKEKINNDKSQ